VPPLVLLAGLGAALVSLQERIDARLGTFRAQEEALYLWSGEQVRKAAPGFEGLLADVYWLRTVQYFGGRRLYAEGKRFELLAPLIDITTALDPRLEVAYRYGAIFLSEPVPVGAGRPQEGVALLERGAKALPKSWRLRQDQGFFTHLFLKDSVRAADILREARGIEGAPYWLETLAASLLAKGGDRQASRRMWQQMYDQAEEGVIKANAAANLRVLTALDDADLARAAVLRFQERFGRLPSSLAEARARGLAVPLADPADHAFVYDPATGGVAISPNSPLWRPSL
jgi:hypothetical protein